jgi:hypothetical protein
MIPFYLRYTVKERNLNTLVGLLVSFIVCGFFINPIIYIYVCVYVCVEWQVIFKPCNRPVKLVFDYGKIWSNISSLFEQTSLSHPDTREVLHTNVFFSVVQILISTHVSSISGYMDWSDLLYKISKYQCMFFNGMLS